MEGSKRERLIILGASGHGKVVADIAKLVGYRDIVFLDDNPMTKDCGEYKVWGPISLADEIEGELFPAIGNSEIRNRLMNTYAERVFPVLIHPRSVVAGDVDIDAGSVVMAGAIVNPSAKVGKGCIINTSSSIDHDCVVGDFCHIAVGAHLCGTVFVEKNVWIGAGAIVSNNINICPNVRIGAGAVVVKNVEQEGTYVGIPARRKSF